MSKEDFLEIISNLSKYHREHEKFYFLLGGRGRAGGREIKHRGHTHACTYTCTCVCMQVWVWARAPSLFRKRREHSLKYGSGLLERLLEGWSTSMLRS